MHRPSAYSLIVVRCRNSYIANVDNFFINGITELGKDAKSQLLHILFTDTVFSKVTRPLDAGLTMTTASLAKCFLGTNKKIVYPLLE